jgi:DNA-binding FadR family transcriptional regulator
MELSDYSTEEFDKDDLQWHLIINKAAGNKLQYTSTQMVLDLLNESMLEVVYKLGREDGRHYHRIITDALKNHEYEKALNEMCLQCDRHFIDMQKTSNSAWI